MAFVLLNLDRSSFESSLGPDQLIRMYSKICVKRPLINIQNKDLNDKQELNEGQKFCRAFCNTFYLH